MRILRNRITHTLLMEMYGTATLEKSMTVSYKSKHVLTKQPSSSTPLHSSQRNENLCAHKNLSTNVCISALFIIARNWKHPVFFPGYKAKQTMDSPHRGILFNKKKEQTIHAHNDLG